MTSRLINVQDRPELSQLCSWNEGFLWAIVAEQCELRKLLFNLVFTSLHKSHNAEEETSAAVFTLRNITKKIMKLIPIIMLVAERRFVSRGFVPHIWVKGNIDKYYITIWTANSCKAWQMSEEVVRNKLSKEVCCSEL